jgi:8-amino-7-oxononanoate synthase
MPYGEGGGGSLRWSGLSDPDVLVYSSLAKGLGVPVAVLAGSRPWICKYKENSLTRVHCSQPSAAALRAAEHAVACNRRDGDARRARLVAQVRRFRRGLSVAGVAAGRGLFPVQTIRSANGMAASALHRRLAEHGVRTVLNRGDNGIPIVSFLFTAVHALAEIDAAVSAINAASLLRPVTSKEINYEKPVCH